MSHVIPLMTPNPNCDGAHCTNRKGEVRVYPLGGGNLILCYSCWNHENLYRAERARKYNNPENWPEQDWQKAKVYDGS